MVLCALGQTLGLGLGLGLGGCLGGCLGFRFGFAFGFRRTLGSRLLALRFRFGPGSSGIISMCFGVGVGFLIIAIALGLQLLLPADQLYLGCLCKQRNGANLKTGGGWFMFVSTWERAMSTHVNTKGYLNLIV